MTIIISILNLIFRLTKRVLTIKVSTVDISSQLKKVLVIVIDSSCSLLLVYNP